MYFSQSKFHCACAYSEFSTSLSIWYRDYRLRRLHCEYLYGAISQYVKITGPWYTPVWRLWPDVTVSVLDIWQRRSEDILLFTNIGPEMQGTGKRPSGGGGMIRLYRAQRWVVILEFTLYPEVIYGVMLVLLFIKSNFNISSIIYVFERSVLNILMFYLEVQLQVWSNHIQNCW